MIEQQNSLFTMEFIKELIFVFWFFAPAGVANVTAFSAGKIPGLKKFSYPVDFGFKFRGKRILGSHKTIRGFLAGIVSAIIIVYLQIFLYEHLWFVRQLISLDYSKIDPLLFGFLSGFGALAGDSIKSFFKRQMNIPPGKSWVPFDQIDYIVGGIFFTSFYIKLTLVQYLLLTFLWVIIHPATTFIGYLLRLKEEPL